MIVIYTKKSKDLFLYIGRMRHEISPTILQLKRMIEIVIKKKNNNDIT